MRRLFWRFVEWFSQKRAAKHYDRSIMYSLKNDDINKAINDSGIPERVVNLSGGLNNRLSTDPSSFRDSQGRSSDEDKGS